MLTLAVAASAFAACNKQETTPVDVNKSLKSVTLNLANATFTKSATNDALKADDAVTLNSMQVFFSDGTNLYQAYDATGKTAATTWFTAVPTGEDAQFHFLPNEVVEVIVLANHGQQDLGTVDATTKKFPTTKAQLLAKIQNLDVNAKQIQNAKNLPLYGIDSNLEFDGESHAKDHGHNNPVYLAADVKLVPAVARFEVVGFQYAENPNKAEATETTPEVPARKYQQVGVDQLVFRNYNTTAVVNSFAGDATASGADENALATLTLGDGNIFTWFADMLTKGWYADEPAVALAKDVDYTWGMVPAVANVAPKAEFSYHVFPGTMIPEFDLKIKGNGTADLPTVPLYLKTGRLMNGGVALAEIEAGVIYRMAMVFDDNDFENPEKCIDLEVEVAEWAVKILTPEF